MKKIISELEYLRDVLKHSSNILYSSPEANV